MEIKKKYYLDNEAISEIIFNYMKFRKKEKELLEILNLIISKIQGLEKFNGYSYDVKQNMNQTAMFNFFNYIYDIKFSVRKVNSIVRNKNINFFNKYFPKSILKNFSSREFFCYALKNRKTLICYLITNNPADKKITLKLRKGLTDFYFREINYDDKISYEINYDFIDFNFFSFITQIVVTSFYQVINKEKKKKEINQVLLWEKTNCYKYDISAYEDQEKIIDIIKKIKIINKE